MAMGNRFAAQMEAAGAVSVGSGEKLQRCFPAVKGVVTIKLPEVENPFVLPLIKDLKVCNAFEGPNGKIHELCGQPYNYIVEHIYMSVFTEELSNARIATCKYAQEIAEAYEKGEVYVETIFGLKHLSRTKKKEEPKAKFQTLEDAMSIFYIKP